jgi:hypothetical protein
VNIRSGATSPRAVLSKNLRANAAAVAAIATKYCDDLEGAVAIFPSSSLYPAEIRYKSRLSALSFRRVAMTGIVSDALKENKSKILQKLITVLTDGLDG